MGQELSGRVSSRGGGMGRAAEVCGKSSSGKGSTDKPLGWHQKGSEEPEFALLQECDTLGGFNLLPFPLIAI